MINKFEEAKNFGHVAVMTLCCEAERKGIVALRPEGDNRQFDVVLMPDNGTFIRVQIKSTMKLDKKGRHAFIIGYGGNHSKAYTKEHIDLVALYAFDVDQWTFIPVEDLGVRKTLKITKKGKWEKYVENWKLITHYGKN